jgi:hypothetical protein
MTADHVEHLREHGFAIVRGFLTAAEIADVKRETDKVMAEGLRHHASYRDRNLMFEILNDPGARRRVLLQAHWFVMSWRWKPCAVTPLPRDHGAARSRHQG